MATVLVYAVLFIFVTNVVDGSTVEPSIAHTVFLPREFDPFCDPYLETIIHMSVDELIALPKLSDTQLLTQLSQGFDSIPTQKKLRTDASSLFDPSADELIKYQGDIEHEWGTLMAGAPAGINFMSAVMAIASKKDFPLKADFDYKFIKYPNSFRTTLVQTSNDMYTALYGAHTSMDKIQLNMHEIPALLKRALMLITQASTSMVKAMLPRTLSNIGHYANESAAAARASLEQFENLQKLLAEIFEVSTSTNSENENIAHQLANETQNLEEQKENMDEILASLSAAYETARKDLETARANYHAAMMNVPGGQWNPAAWQVYVANRPLKVSCSGWWIFRKCRTEPDYRFQEYTAEAKKKAQEAIELLKAAEQHYKDLFNQQIDKQNELGITMQNLSQINFNALSINETIKVLTDASGKLSIVHAQWTRITLFFSKLAAVADHTRMVILENFIGTINDMESLGKPLDPIDKELYMTMLVESATDIDRDAHLLFIMAKTYSDISSEYLMDQVASLPGLLTISTDEERDAYVKQMVEKSEETSEKVKQLADERQKKYELASIDRQKQYMDFLQAVKQHEEEEFFNGYEIGKR